MAPPRRSPFAMTDEDDSLVMAGVGVGLAPAAKAKDTKRKRPAPSGHENKTPNHARGKKKVQESDSESEDDAPPQKKPKASVKKPSPTTPAHTPAPKHKRQALKELDTMYRVSPVQGRRRAAGLAAALTVAHADEDTPEAKPKPSVKSKQGQEGKDAVKKRKTAVVKKKQAKESDESDVEEEVPAPKKPAKKGPQKESEHSDVEIEDVTPPKPEPAPAPAARRVTLVDNKQKPRIKPPASTTAASIPKPSIKPKPAPTRSPADSSAFEDDVASSGSAQGAKGKGKSTVEGAKATAKPTTPGGKKGGRGANVEDEEEVEAGPVAAVARVATITVPRHGQLASATAAPSSSAPNAVTLAKPSPHTTATTALTLPLPPATITRTSDEGFVQMLKTLEGNTVKFVENCGTVSENEALKAVRADLTALQKKYDELRNTVGPHAQEHYEFVKRAGEELQNVHEQELAALRAQIAHLESRVAKGGSDSESSGSGSAKAAKESKKELLKYEQELANARAEVEALRSQVDSIPELQGQVTELERMRELYEDLTGVKVTGVFQAEEDEDGEGDGNGNDTLEFECEQKVKSGTLHYVMQLQQPSAASGEPAQYIYAPTDETRADVANGLVPGYFGKNVQFAKSNGGRWFRLGVQKGW